MLSFILMLYSYFANLVELREKYGKDTPLDELVKLDQKQDLK